jgi:hypothetical protein
MKGVRDLLGKEESEQGDYVLCRWRERQIVIVNVVTSNALLQR